MGTEDGKKKVLLKVSHLGKVFGEGDQAVTALQDVNLEIRQSEFVMIVGPSG